MAGVLEATPAIFECALLIGPFLGAGVVAILLSRSSRFAPHSIWLGALGRTSLWAGLAAVQTFIAVSLSRGPLPWLIIADLCALLFWLVAGVTYRRFRRELNRIPV